MIRQLISMTLSSVFLCAMLSLAFAADTGDVGTSGPSKHFDPKGKLPSQFTIELQARLRESLPFEDTRDFEEARRVLLQLQPISKLWLKPVT